MLALRRAHPALRLGSFETLFADASLLVLRRVYEGEGDAVLAAFNLGSQAATHGLADAVSVGTELLALNGARCAGRVLHLPPGAAWIASA